MMLGIIALGYGFGEAWDGRYVFPVTFKAHCPMVVGL